MSVPGPDIGCTRIFVHRNVVFFTFRPGSSIGRIRSCNCSPCKRYGEGKEGREPYMVRRVGNKKLYVQGITPTLVVVADDTSEGGRETPSQAQQTSGECSQRPSRPRAQSINSGGI